MLFLFLAFFHKLHSSQHSVYWAEISDPWFETSRGFNSFLLSSCGGVIAVLESAAFSCLFSFWEEGGEESTSVVSMLFSLFWGVDGLFSELSSIGEDGLGGLTAGLPLPAKKGIRSFACSGPISL